MLHEIACHMPVVCWCDDGEVYCRVYDPFIKDNLLCEWEIGNFHNPYAKQIKVHLKLLRAPHVTKTVELKKKLGELVMIHQIHQTF